MGSKGRMPPPQHLRRPLPQGLPVLHHDPMVPPMHHALRDPMVPPMHHAMPPGPFDLLAPPQMEQKLASQHGEMQRLGTENQRLAATHGVLRQELAGAQHELQMLHAQVGSLKAEREQQMRAVLDKIAKMEAELKAADPVKMELQQARGEAQNLVMSREELISKAQHLSQEIQRVHADVQQIPALISELECLRQQYQHCRATYDYEKKLYNDHLESLQGMEKNYVSMSKEVEKLRAELTNTANVDRRSSGPYGGTSGTNDNEAGLPVGQNAYEDGYAAVQGLGPLPAASGGGSAATTPAGAQPGTASTGIGYEAPRGPGYIASAGLTYDAQRGASYDPQRLTGHEAFRGSAYDSKRGPTFDAQRTGYDPQRSSGYDMQRGPAYDISRGPAYDPSRAAAGYDAQSRGVAGPQDSRAAAGYDAQARGMTGPQGHVPQVNMSYGSTTPPARGGGGGFDVVRGANPARR